MDVTGSIKASFAFLKAKPLVFVPAVLSAVIAIFTQVALRRSLLQHGEWKHVVNW